MKEVEEFKAMINTGNGLWPKDTEAMKQFIELFESNKFQEAYSFLWTMDEDIRGVIPEVIIKELNSEVF